MDRAAGLVAREQYAGEPQRGRGQQHRAQDRIERRHRCGGNDGKRRDGRHRQCDRGDTPSSVRPRRVGEQRPGGPKPVGGAATERLAGLPRHETAQPLVRCEPERAQPLRRRPARIGQVARREATRRNNPDQRAAPAQRQKARGGGLDQVMIVERTLRPGHGLERLVGCAEGGRQRVEIGLFGNRIGSDQDPVGAKTDRLCPALRGGENAARQQIAQAREFRAEARRHRFAAGFAKFRGKLHAAVRLPRVGRLPQRRHRTPQTPPRFTKQPRAIDMPHPWHAAGICMLNVNEH